MRLSKRNILFQEVEFQLLSCFWGGVYLVSSPSKTIKNHGCHLMDTQKVQQKKTFQGCIDLFVQTKMDKHLQSYTGSTNNLHLKKTDPLPVTISPMAALRALGVFNYLGLNPGIQVVFFCGQLFLDAVFDKNSKKSRPLPKNRANPFLIGHTNARILCGRSVDGHLKFHPGFRRKSIHQYKPHPQTP